MSRSRLYALIDAFEADMRGHVERYLLADLGDEAVLGDQYEITVQRRARDSAGEDSSLLHYLDLRPCFDILSRYKKELPQALADEISGASGQLDVLVPIRHRVAHGRPLGIDDPDRAVSALRPFSSRFWPETQALLARLGSEPTWEPTELSAMSKEERVLHNLPEVDYEETGFVGRVEQLKTLRAALERRRESVITITGEGGIGKTALALDLAYSLLDSATNPYEAILWVSLKTERLGAYGVEELHSAIRGFDETVTALGRGLERDFTGSLEDLAQSLDGITALVIVDNLESAQGTEVIQLYEMLPDSINYLFTSRLGIGQLERRYPLEPLSENEAKQLFRRFARMRGQKQLAGLSDEALGHVVEELRRSPLAIRWYVLSAEAGAVPLDLLRSQRELLEFCVRNVYDVLSTQSKAVLRTLQALQRAVSFEEFAVLSDMEIDELRRATQELTRGSLVGIEGERNAVNGRLALTPTARAFLGPVDSSDKVVLDLLRRDRALRSANVTKAMSGSSIALDRVLIREPSDRPVAQLLMTAISFSKNGQRESARRAIERATEFAPEFSEVYRVAGDVEVSAGSFEAAVVSYRQAEEYATSDQALALALYGLASVLGRNLHDLVEAIPQAERAYDLWPNEDSAALLGNLLVWTGRYADGQELLETVLETATGRRRQHAATAHVDSWKRWADEAVKSGDFVNALNRALAGWHSARSFKSPRQDFKAVEVTFECCAIAIRAASALGNPAVGDPRLVVCAEYLAENAQRVTGSKRANYLHDGLVKFVRTNLFPSEVARAINRAVSGLESDPRSRLVRRFD